MSARTYPRIGFGVLALLLLSSFLPFLFAIGSAQVEPSFTVSVVPTSGRVAQGDGITATILISLSGNWDNKRISLSATGVPTGAYAQLTPDNVYSMGGSLSSTLTIGTSLSTSVGTHEIAIVAEAENMGEAQSATYTLSVEVGADFSVNVNPSHGSVNKGETTTAVVVITASGGFSQPVQLSVGGVPSGVDISVSPSTSTPPFESIITVRASENMPPGEHAITLTASGGEKAHATVYNLEIQPAENETTGADPIGKIILGAIAISLVAAAAFVAKS